MPDVVGIPVDMFNTNIGSATLHEDGSITMTVGPSELTSQLVPMFADGLHIGFVLSPRSNPVPPPPDMPNPTPPTGPGANDQP